MRERSVPAQECPSPRNMWSFAFDYIRMIILFVSEAWCMALQAVVETNLPGLTLLGRGKVRDIYEVNGKLLLVASDRLSAFDVVLPDGIPGKGQVLTQISAFWFRKLAEIVPNHMLTIGPGEFLPA